MGDDQSTQQPGTPTAGGSDRYVFSSAAWVGCVRDLVSERLAGVDLHGASTLASFSEEFTDPPAHLPANGARTVGWHFVIADGTVAVHGHPLPEADRRVFGDYATVVELARLPHADPRFGPLAQAALDAGKLRLEGNQSDQRILEALSGLHDALVPITA